jgi:predicted methyltransferase
MPVARRDDLDQCPATLGTTLRRLALLMDVVNLEGRRLLLLGDDDLLSVAISASQLSTHVTVLDLDQSLLAYIARWTSQEVVELVHHDLRMYLPNSLAACYDVVFTDPPYTEAGQLLFLRSAMTALRRVPGSSVFICASRLYLKPRDMQRIIILAEHAGLQLSEIKEDFNRYKAPPNMLGDLRRSTRSHCGSYFYSSLLHFVLRNAGYSPELLPFKPNQIYHYEDLQN